MEFLAYLIPLIVSIFLLAFYKKEIVWWEYALLIAIPILVHITSRAIMLSYNTADVEYLGDYITKVRHYDEWDEWVHRTCTRTYKSGNTTRTQTYDCSYRRYHPERWSYFDQNGDEHWLYYEKDYDAIRRKFGTPEVFIDMHRDYHLIDGDAQEYHWNGSESTAWTVTHEHKYKNKIQNSNSIFNFTDISKKEADTLGLYHYPNIDYDNDYDQTPVLTTRTIPQNHLDALKFVNGFYGKKYQFRVYVLIFENESIEISELQRSYWKGGNKNELVVCLGMNGAKVEWCNAFSWCDVPTVDVKTETFFVENEYLDLLTYSKLLRESLENGEWERKRFEDFDYIKVDLTFAQEIVTLIISLILNVVLAIVFIKNDESNWGL